jgi:hypothetical protein
MIIKSLFSLLFKVIVCTNIYFKYKQQEKFNLVPQITFLTHLLNSCMKEFVFPIFPSLA